MKLKRRLGPRRFRKRDEWRDAGLVEAIIAAGGLERLAEHLGVTVPAVWSWKRIPAERCPAVAAVTGIPREVLRPDIYRSIEELSS